LGPGIVRVGGLERVVAMGAFPFKSIVCFRCLSK
jgi:hypothetical protein